MQANNNGVQSSLGATTTGASIIKTGAFDENPTFNNVIANSIVTGELEVGDMVVLNVSAGIEGMTSAGPVHITNNEFDAFMVDGQSTFADDVGVTGTLTATTISTSNFSFTGPFTALDTADVLVNGEDELEAALVSKGGLGVEKSAIIKENLTVMQEIYVDSVGDASIETQGGAMIGKDMTVGEDLDVGGNTTLGADVDVTGNTTIGGTLGATGSITTGGDISVAGNGVIEGTLVVESLTEAGGAGIAASTAALVVKGGAVVEKSITVVGDVITRGDMQIDGVLRASTVVYDEELTLGDKFIWAINDSAPAYYSYAVIPDVAIFLATADSGTVSKMAVSLDGGTTFTTPDIPAMTGTLSVAPLPASFGTGKWALAGSGNGTSFMIVDPADVSASTLHDDAEIWSAVCVGTAGFPIFGARTKDYCRMDAAGVVEYCTPTIFSGGHLTGSVHVKTMLYDAPNDILVAWYKTSDSSLLAHTRDMLGAFTTVTIGYPGASAPTISFRVPSICQEGDTIYGVTSPTTPYDTQGQLFSLGLSGSDVALTPISLPFMVVCIAAGGDGTLLLNGDDDKMYVYTVADDEHAEYDPHPLVELTSGIPLFTLYQPSSDVHKIMTVRDSGKWPKLLEYKRIASLLENGAISMGAGSTESSILTNQSLSMGKARYASGYDNDTMILDAQHLKFEKAEGDITEITPESVTTGEVICDEVSIENGSNVTGITPGLASFTNGTVTKSIAAEGFKAETTGHRSILGYDGLDYLGTGPKSFTMKMQDIDGDATYKLHLRTGGSEIKVVPGTAGVYMTSGQGAWTAISDRRMKDDIKDLDYGLEEVLALKPRSFKYKTCDKTNIGFIAQEVYEVVPDVVDAREPTWGLRMTDLIPVLVNSIKELNAKVDLLTPAATAPKKRKRATKEPTLPSIPEEEAESSRKRARGFSFEA